MGMLELVAEWSRVRRRKCALNITFLTSSIWLLVGLAVFLYLLAALLLFPTHTDLPTLNDRSSFYLSRFLAQALPGRLCPHLGF